MLVFGSPPWPILLPAKCVLLGRVHSGGDERAVQAFAERAGTAEAAGLVFVGFAMCMWLSLFLRCPGTALRQEQVRGTLEAALLTPVSRLAVIFGPPVAHVWPVLIQFGIVAVALNVLFAVVTPPDALLRAGIVIAVGVPSMCALASLFAAAVLRFGEINPAVRFVRGSSCSSPGSPIRWRCCRVGRRPCRRPCRPRTSWTACARSCSAAPGSTRPSLCPR